MTQKDFLDPPQKEGEERIRQCKGCKEEAYHTYCVDIRGNDWSGHYTAHYCECNNCGTQVVFKRT